MTFSPTLPVRSIATALASLALAAPAAVAAPADYRAPGALDSWQPVQDLRSPDARDIATVSRPHLAHPTIAAPRVQSTDEGFDWGSAAIGAAALGGLVLLAAGAWGTAHRARVRVAR